VPDARALRRESRETIIRLRRDAHSASRSCTARDARPFDFSPAEARRFLSKPSRREADAEPVLLYYVPEMEHVALEVVRRVNDSGATDAQLRLGMVEWKTFGDGFPNIFIRDAHFIEGSSVTVIVSFHSPAVIFQQIALLYALAQYRARNLRVVLPFFPTGTMERIDEVGEVPTAVTLARMLSATPFCATGPATITVFDIHTLQNQFYFSDNVLVQLKSAVYLLRNVLADLPDADDVSIAFPDEGAFKRFKAKFREFPLVICKKVRDGDSRAVKIHEGAPAGRHVVIVDDLVQTGGTILGCAQALLDAGAGRVSAYVTHGVFPNDSWRRFVPPACTLFERFWVTDTVPTTAEKVRGSAPFEVLSIAPLISFLLHRG
jgi:ribose-phosphate pyrophosphokinase